ncbi:MAG: DUF3617 domain-containing protein [Burkholderiaceae bacterium]
MSGIVRQPGEPVPHAAARSSFSFVSEIRMSCVLHRAVLATFVGLGLLGQASSAYAEPRIEPGLWKMTPGGEFAAQMAQQMKMLEQQLATMPPETQAQMRAMLSEQMKNVGGPQMTCITAEDLKKGLTHMIQQEGSAADDECKQTITWQGKVGAVTMQCRDGARGQGRITVSSPKAVRTEMKLTGADGSPMSMNFTGEWIKADCGKTR